VLTTCHGAPSRGSRNTATVVIACLAGSVAKTGCPGAARGRRGSGARRCCAIITGAIGWFLLALKSEGPRSRSGSLIGKGKTGSRGQSRRERPPRQHLRRRRAADTGVARDRQVSARAPLHAPGRGLEPRRRLPAQRSTSGGEQADRSRGSTPTEALEQPRPSVVTDTVLPSAYRRQPWRRKTKRHSSHVALPGSRLHGRPASAPGEAGAEDPVRFVPPLGLRVILRNDDVKRLLSDTEPVTPNRSHWEFHQPRPEGSYMRCVEEHRSSAPLAAR
jgi:hypothetical protein